MNPPGSSWIQLEIQLDFLAGYFLPGQSTQKLTYDGGRTRPGRVEPEVVLFLVASHLVEAARGEVPEDAHHADVLLDAGAQELASQRAAQPLCLVALWSR